MAKCIEKENIEQRPATRCFPEGRKTLFYFIYYRQEFAPDFSSKAALKPLLALTLLVRKSSSYSWANGTLLYKMF